MTDTLELMTCPACGKPMEKVYIPSEDFFVDVCVNGCGGIFFDNREFDYVNEEHEDISDIVEKLKDKHFESVDENATRICPCCGAEMIKNQAGLKSNITVDDCYKCGGKFLDNAELLKIRDEYQNDSQRTYEAITSLYNKAGRQLAKTDRDFAMTKVNRSKAKKLFDSLFGF